MGDGMAISFPREFVECVTQAITQAHSRKQRAHTLGRTVEPIDQNAPDPIGWLLLNRRALELLIGLRKGSRTGLRSVAQVPDNTAADNGGQVHFVSQAVTVLLVCQEVGRQGESTPRQHRHQTVVAEGTDQAIERHRRDMPNHRTQLQTQPPMRRQ
jgi:hypothetical protein